MTEPTEVWKPVVGYEGWYEVSDLGRVRRVAPTPKGVIGYVLQPSVSSGYQVLHLSTGTNAGRKLHAVHRLVAAAFIGQCPEGYVVNHLDADRSNNSRENLEIRDARRQPGSHGKAES